MSIAVSVEQTEVMGIFTQGSLERSQWRPDLQQRRSWRPQHHVATGSNTTGMPEATTAATTGVVPGTDGTDIRGAIKAAATGTASLEADPPPDPDPGPSTVETTTAGIGTTASISTAAEKGKGKGRSKGKGK